MILEKVDEKNFDEFFGLIIKLAEFEKLTPPDEAAKKRMKRHATQDNPYYEAYICRVDNKPIGYLFFFMSYSSFLGRPTLYLEDIFVLKEFRGKGYGKKMFNFLIKQAQDRDCGRMEWCALKWNKKAIEFYEKMGAKPLDEWTYFRLTQDKFYEARVRNES